MGSPDVKLSDYYTVNEETGCWEFNRKAMKDGYGIIQRRPNRWLAHRLSWIINHGDIPDGLLVCHKCDNRKCVNPDHLFLGTHKDNTQDCIKKGRFSGYPHPGKGTSHRDAKLSDKDIQHIKQMYQRYGPGYRGLCLFLSEWFNVTKTTIQVYK